MKRWICAICLIPFFFIATTALSYTESGPAPVYRSTAQIELSIQLERYDGESEGIVLTNEILRMVSAQYIAKAWSSMQVQEDEIKLRVVAIEAHRIEGSSFVEIRVDSIDPILAAKLANALADTYISAKEYPAAIIPSIRQTARPSSLPLDQNPTTKE